jgi:ATP phosphoribosyltransferase regulatory subunit HisZ
VALGFQTRRAADFQIGVEQAGLETRNTADLEVCATKTEMRAVLGNRDKSC